MESKSILKSKTFWLGVLNVLAGIIAYLQGELQAGAGLTLNGVAIVVLRLVTNQAVTIFGEKK